MAACAANAPSEDEKKDTPPASETDSKSDGVYTNGGFKLTVPAEYNDLLIVETPEADKDGVLFNVSEKASVEAGKAIGDDGAGWLFGIARISEDKLHEMMCSEMAGNEAFAKDADGNIYMYLHPTDVRFVRESYDDIEADQKQWTELNEWASTVPGGFMAENAGLEAVRYTNTGVDIYLSRLAYMGDLDYTVSTTQYGPMDPPKDFDAAPYLERLLSGVTFESVDISETPDGEYVVLNLPDEDVRLDFFPGNDNYVREVSSSYESLYKATYADGSTEASAIMQEWYDALVAESRAGKAGFNADGLIGTWAEKVAGRGVIEISKGAEEGKYDVHIQWSSSAFEQAIWDMTAAASGENAITYGDCKQVIRTYESETKFTDEVMYENGTGAFSLNSDNELLWRDYVEDAGGGTVFISAD